MMKVIMTIITRIMVVTCSTFYASTFVYVYSTPSWWGFNRVIFCNSTKRVKLQTGLQLLDKNAFFGRPRLDLKIFHERF